MTEIREQNGGARDGSELSRIEARLERIENTLARFETMMGQAPGLVAMAGDVADEWARNDGQADARLKELLSLIQRATRPDVLRSLQVLVEQIEAAPGIIAMLGDVVDEFAVEAEVEGVDMHAATSHFVETVRVLVKLLGHSEMRELLRSGALSPEALRTVNVAARALGEASARPTEKVGLFSFLSRTRSPHVQRALGLLLNSAESLGRELAREDSHPPQPPRLQPASES